MYIHVLPYRMSIMKVLETFHRALQGYRHAFNLVNNVIKAFILKIWYIAQVECLKVFVFVMFVACFYLKFQNVIYRFRQRLSMSWTHHHSIYCVFGKTFSIWSSDSWTCWMLCNLYFINLTTCISFIIHSSFTEYWIVFYSKKRHILHTKF